MPVIHRTFQCFSHLSNRLSSCAACCGIVSCVCFWNMWHSSALAHTYTHTFSSTCPARQNVGDQAAALEFCLNCCVGLFFFLLSAGVNERDSLQYLVSSCTGSEEQQRRNAPSCWYSEGGDRMARCLPQVNGNRPSKCLCSCAPSK